MLNTPLSRPAFNFTRRQLMQAAAVGSTTSLASMLGLSGCAAFGGAGTKAKVVVVGGGFGGATAAKYVRLFSQQQVEVVLVEPLAAFVSCPMSNRVLSGAMQLAELTRPFDTLTTNHGVKIIRSLASAIDTHKKTVTLASGDVLAYDKLIISPGVELMWDTVAGLKAARDTQRIVQAWKAGPETTLLRQQLQAMPDGGVFAITVPEAPYRCPPGPYERACLVAGYFKAAKPRSKVLILDANPDVTSKPALFKKVWAEKYPGIVDYQPNFKAVAVDAKTGVIKFEVQEDVKADVLNVLPAMRAGSIAVKTGLNNQAGQRWCGVNYLTFESTAAKDVHVLGDAILAAPAMPKSAHMANNHAKVAAAAIVAELAGWSVNPSPMLTNTCYSFVDPLKVIHVASVHSYVAAEKTFRAIVGAGGLSAAPNELEGVYALNWASNTWADTLI